MENLSIEKINFKNKEEAYILRENGIKQLRETYKPIDSLVKTFIGNDAWIDVCLKSNNNIIGFLSYKIHHSTLSIKSLVIDKNYRGYKISKKFIMRIVEENKFNGEISLWCVKETGNDKIFMKMGFLVKKEEISKIFVLKTTNQPATEVNLILNI